MMCQSHSCPTTGAQWLFRLLSVPSPREWYGSVKPCKFNVSVCRSGWLSKFIASPLAMKAGCKPNESSSLLSEPYTSWMAVVS